RLYTAEWDRRRRRWVVTVDDVQDLTGLALEVTDVGTIDAYTFEPVNNDAKGKPFERLVVDPTSSARPTGADDEVAITALWGWSSVPVAVEEAAMLQAARFHARRFSPYGVAGSPDQGSEMRLLARLDADVTVALVGYRRWWAAA
ncbi:MAG TPA: phage gp6-like head-tail connector protein, partial [Planctomycetota bacterium]|nr:phage gp6-like head-tail connector protein [Planctomycetota bacterium]